MNVTMFTFIGGEKGLSFKECYSHLSFLSNTKTIFKTHFLCKFTKLLLLGIHILSETISC